MTQSQTLLSKIAALRQRLEQAQGLMRDADSAAAALAKKGDPNAALRRKVEASARQQSMLETALQQLPEIAKAAGDNAFLPTHLTARAARLLRRADELLKQLRAIHENDLPNDGPANPICKFYRDTVSMTDAVLRTVQAFPGSPSVQSHLCEGLEAVLTNVAERLGSINDLRRQRQREESRRESLAEILMTLAGGNFVDRRKLEEVAESVQGDVFEGAALSFPPTSMADLPRHIAAHCLAVGQVIARITRQDPSWRSRALELIMAALIHDVGMLGIPAAVLANPGSLSDDQRRMVESHAIRGADMAGRITPNTEWLVEAAAQHHERLDGVGYPAGLKDMQIKPFIRLLAVCDIYAAFCQNRPQRVARDTRTALTDTLLLAEQGGLDPNCAERLLLLSFYPVGTVVELSDGTVGVVVATHQSRRDLNAPLRPVVALLTDPQGDFLAFPLHADLAETEGRSVLRTLPAAERHERLGRRYPHLASFECPTKKAA